MSKDLDIFLKEKINVFKLPWALKQFNVDWRAVCVCACVCTCTCMLTRLCWVRNKVKRLMTSCKLWVWPRLLSLLLLFKTKYIEFWCKWHITCCNKKRKDWKWGGFILLDTFLSSFSYLSLFQKKIYIYIYIEKLIQAQEFLLLFNSWNEEKYTFM